MKFETVEESLFKWRFGLLSSKNFATMATWHNYFSSLFTSIIWIKSFSSAVVFFRRDERLYHSLYFNYIFIGFKNSKILSQKRMGSPEICCIDTYLSSTTYHIKKGCQSIVLYHSHFCLVTQREGAVRDKTKRLYGGPILYELSRLLCRHERCFPTKELKKRCVTKQRTAAQKCTNKTNTPT